MLHQQNTIPLGGSLILEITKDVLRCLMIGHIESIMTSKAIVGMVEEQKNLNHIYMIQGQKVMLDRDLAYIYGVETRVLNQRIKRNLNCFPQDFMFQLLEKE